MLTTVLLCLVAASLVNAEVATPEGTTAATSTSPSPQSNDTCLLPKKTGPCRANIRQFYYRASTKRCERFVYGGCDGNDNRFNTRQECQENCNTDLCFFPKDAGSCKAHIPRFFYNSTSQQCEEFIYGGCEGNSNRFETREHCLSRCQNAKPNPVCKLPAESGRCLAYSESFHFNVTSGKCEMFVYGGCGGNGNRFVTQKKCQETCEHIPPKDDKKICNLQPDSGLCDALFPKYFYNATSQSCEGFNYGGCAGNENRFDSEEECIKSCRDY